MRALSEVERQALRDRAAGLKAELSAEQSRREQAEQVATQANDDVNLLREVARLEAEVAVAKDATAAAEGSVDNALQLMAKLASESSDQTKEQVVESAPVSNEEEVEAKAEAEEEVAVEVEVASVAEQDGDASLFDRPIESGTEGN